MTLRELLKRALGTAWHVNSNEIVDSMTPAVDGVVEAGKPVVADANKAVDELHIAGADASNLMLQDAKFTTAALESATIAAASVAGAKIVAHINTGTTPGNLQFPTAAALVAAIPGAKAGQSYLLKIRNGSGSANTATITTNTGITLTGTMTIAQNVTRDLLVTLTSLTAVDVRSVGISAAGA